jgi:hypothetical protein
MTHQVTQDKLYDKWTNLDCLSFLVEQANGGTFDMAIREKHGGPCPGDPNTAPVVDRFRVTGDRVIFWLNPQGEYVDYEQVKVFR